jgi:energy-coupling factor transport system substrate-specific component
VSWPLAAYGLLALALAVGFAWYERSRPDARIVALVGTLAAFAALGRIAFAAVPNVKPTSDIVLIAGFSLGAGPGFAVGAIAGLASNFFFGQGPWTPWQMAAWGATGVLGALLARGCAVRGGRGSIGADVGDPAPGATGAGAGGGDTPLPSIGRWPLALICAGAGFAFTAVQDVGDWVTYSGHGLAALSAYVASGLGFDGIYAAACFGFALAFGPALLRSVQRFARRIEVTWIDVAEPGVRASGLAIVAVLAGGSLLGPATVRARAATSPSAARRAATSTSAETRAVRYLEHAQNRDGGVGAAPGQASAQLFTGWAALGLASAGVDVATLRRGHGVPLLTYVRGGEGASDPGSLERTILVLRAAGASATAPRNLVAELVHRISADGSVSGQANLTAFAVLALRAAGGPGTGALDARGLRWLAGEADRDGGFGFDGRGSGSDADDTGAVLEAFGSSPAPAVVRARRRAVGFLRRDQDSDGGFSDGAGAGSNAQSTAWAVQGLLAAGVSPGSLRRDGHSPLGYLTGLVSAAGAVSYARGQTQTPVWVTGEALMALTGTPLPIVGGSVPATPATTSTSGSTATATATVTVTATATAKEPVAAGTGTGTATGTATATATNASPGTASAVPRRRRSGHASTVGGAGDAPTGPGSRPVERAMARMEAAVSALPRRVIAAARLGS